MKTLWLHHRYWLAPSAFIFLTLAVFYALAFAFSGCHAEVDSLNP